MHKTHHYDAQQTKKVQGGDTWLSCRKNQYEVTCMETKKSIVICKINCSTFPSTILDIHQKMNSRNIEEIAMIGTLVYKL